MIDSENKVAITPQAGGGEWFGHPRGLATLFFTELWERFSYYGMRGILMLFMTDAVATGGLGLTDEKAGAIYGLYTALVFLLALPGGWVADKLWGQRRAVFVGGALIAAGHFTLAVPQVPFFYAGLFLIVIGTGLLKPNVSTIVGDLYPPETDPDGARRDAGFSIFYTGINLGAFLGPLVCGWLGEGVSWHWGFSAAGVGMVLGLIQYRAGEKHFGEVGLLSTQESGEVLRRRQRSFYLTLAAAAAVLVLLVGLVGGGALTLDSEAVATWVGVGIVALALVYFVYLLFFSGLERDDQKRVGAIIFFFFSSAAFWAGYEQAGSSMNLFTDRLTDRLYTLPDALVSFLQGGQNLLVSLVGTVSSWSPEPIEKVWLMPTSWLQSVNPLFIILLAPVLGSFWLYLRERNPSTPAKFALGLVLLASGFFVLAWGASFASEENPVSPMWLVVTYFLHTVGELCLSPVGLSSVTKLAPRGRVGQMMGIWFIGTALGNLIAGLVAGQLEDLSAAALFGIVAVFLGGAGFVALLVSPWVRRLMGSVH